MSNIRKGDAVVVITGRDKGKKGSVLKVFPEDNRALVQGVNVVKRHQKQTQSQQAGIVTKESPIQLSNIAHVDPKSGKATRIGSKTLSDGRKVRFAKKSGEVIDVRRGRQKQKSAGGRQGRRESRQGQAPRRERRYAGAGWRACA